jgi:hypothetical protein
MSLTSIAITDGEINNIQLTNHGSIRLRQRGIQPMAIHLLEKYGKEYFGHCGARVLHFDKQSIRRMEMAEGRHAVRALEKFLDIYRVVSLDTDDIITVGHNYKRTKHFH